MKQKILISLFSVISFLFLINFITAIGGDWKTFGNTGLPAYQTQTSDFFGDFLTSNITSKSISAGYSTSATRTAPYQVLVSDLGSDSTNYIIMPSGNYLQIYNSDLNLINEEFVGEGVIGQISSADWDNDTLNDEIVGIYNFTGNVLSVRAYEFNFSTYNLQLINETNFTLGTASFGSTGFRCVGGTCYGILYDYNSTFATYDWYYLKINSAGYFATEIRSNETTFPREVPSIVDLNSDNVLDFAIFSDNLVVVFDETGSVSIVFNYTSYGAGDRDYIRSAKFINNDATPKWRVAIGTERYTTFASLNGNAQIGIYKVEDGLLMWEQTIIGSGSNTNTIPAFRGLAISDYNGDGYEDTWVHGSRGGFEPLGIVNIYSGLDGTSLYSFSDSSLSGVGGVGGYYPRGQITLGRMGADNILDFLIAGQDVFAVDVGSSSLISFPSSMGSDATCIPVDVDLDGVLEVVCSRSSLTKLYDTNYTNQNPSIISVTFDPSTTIQVSETLYLYPTATDPEGDSPLYYKWKCSSSDSFNSEQTSNSLNCSYAFVGYKNITIAVRDYYHSGEYNYFSYEILVTQTGEVCDNDNICEASQGETYVNCPNDCTAPSQNYTQAEGGISLNTQLVSTTNSQQGLLPDIYYGILSFFSQTLSPLIILVFAIFFVLIMIALATIIKAIGVKVGKLSD